MKFLFANILENGMPSTGVHHAAELRVIGIGTAIDPENIVYRDLSSPFLEILPIEKETLIKRDK